MPPSASLKLSDLDTLQVISEMSFPANNLIHAKTDFLTNYLAAISKTILTTTE